MVDGVISVMLTSSLFALLVLAVVYVVKNRLAGRARLRVWWIVAAFICSVAFSLDLLPVGDLSGLAETIQHGSVLLLVAVAVGEILVDL